MMLARSISVLLGFRGRVVHDIGQGAVDEALMRFGVKGFTEQALSRGDDEAGDLVAQVLDCAITLATDLCARTLDQRLRVGPRLGKDFRSIRRRSLVRAVEDLAGLGARLFERLFDLLLDFGETFLGLLRRTQ